MSVFSSGTTRRASRRRHCSRTALDRSGVAPRSSAYLLPTYYLLTTYLLPTTSLLLVGAQPTYYLLFTTRYAPITKCFHHALRTARCAHCALTKYYSHQVLNFSIAYGKTAHGLSKDWGVTQTEAQVSGACQLQVSKDQGDARPSLALTLTV